MDYYVRPRHLYSHSRSSTRSGVCRRPSRLVASTICYLLDRASVHEISSLVTCSSICQIFPATMEILIALAILEIMVLCIYSSWRFWSMYIVHGDDHICAIMFHAYSWPFYFYVSRTAICMCSYMQSCIMVLCWLGGWSSTWVPSSLHFWDGLIMYFGHRMAPLTSHIRGHLL